MSARHWSTRAALLAFLGLLLAGGASAQGGGEEFSDEERRALVEGRLVRRPTLTSEGSFRYIGGTSFQRVDAPVERVWELVNDVSRYPDLLPGLEEARVVEEAGGRRVVYLRHRYSFVNASYYAFVEADRERRTVTFELDRSRPHDVRAGRGFLAVAPYRGASIVTWGVRADVGNSILTGVFAGVIHDWILKVPTCVLGAATGRVVC